MTYVTGSFITKRLCFTLTCPVISYEVSAILTDVAVPQLRDIPYKWQNLGNSKSEGIAENWIEPFELAEQRRLKSDVKFKKNDGP